MIKQYRSFYGPFRDNEYDEVKDRLFKSDNDYVITWVLITSIFIYEYKVQIKVLVLLY